MAVREIRTRISLDGDREFNAALKEAQRSMRVMGSELKAASAEFEATGNREQLLTTRSRVLRQEIAQQQEIIRSLEQAVSDSASRYGAASAQTDGYRIKLNNATAALSRMQKELEDTDREAEELGRDSRRVGGQIEDGIGDAADETQGKLEAMFASLSRDVGNIRGSVTISAVTDIAEVVGGALSSVAGFVDQYAGERRSQAILGFNARQAGLDDSRIQALRAEMAALTGDSDTAMEALSNLIATGWDIQNIEFAARSLIGAEIAFPETLQAENLAESLQETILGGEATGQIAELAARLGQSEEEFKAAIEAAGTAAGRAEVVLGLLSSDKLTESYNLFTRDDEIQGVLNAARADQALTDELTELSGHVGDAVVTPLKGLGADVADALNTALDEGIGAGAAKLDETLFGGWFGDVSGAAQEAADAAAQGMQGALDAAANTWDAFIRGDFAEAAEASGLTGLWDGLFNPYDTDAERAADEAMTPIRNEITELQQQAADVQNEIANMYALGMPENAAALEEQLAGIQEQIAAKEAELEATGKELGAQTVQGMSDGVAQQGEALTQTAYSAGEASGVSLGNGIAAATPYAVGRAASMADGIMAELARIEAPDIARALQDASATAGAASGSGRGGNVNVNVQVDGRTVARASAPYMNAELGRQASRNA